MRGRPNTGESDVCSLFCLKQAPVCSIVALGLGRYSASAPILMLVGLTSSGAVAIENTIGAV
jgi:hypothetical protein